MATATHSANPRRQHAASTASPRRAQQGLSLVELLSVACICLVLIGQAVPSLQALRQDQLLRAIADTVNADVHFARSAALANDLNVRLAVQALPGGGSCTLVHTGAANACECTGGGLARCDTGAQLLRLSEQPAARGAALTSLDKSLIFDASKGTVTPTATLVVADRDGRSVRQVINIMGRVRSCSPTAAAGFKRC
jgi:type IV fimbrial biogenesis protein FimT